MHLKHSEQAWLPSRYPGNCSLGCRELLGNPSQSCNSPSSLIITNTQCPNQEREPPFKILASLNFAVQFPGHGMCAIMHIVGSSMQENPSIRENDRQICIVLGGNGLCKKNVYIRQNCLPNAYISAKLLMNFHDFKKQHIMVWEAEFKIGERRIAEDRSAHRERWRVAAGALIAKPRRW